MDTKGADGASGVTGYEKALRRRYVGGILGEDNVFSIPAMASRDGGVYPGALHANTVGRCESRAGRLRTGGLRAPASHRQAGSDSRSYGTEDQFRLRNDHARDLPGQHEHLPAQASYQLECNGDGESDGKGLASPLRRTQLLFPD